MAETSLATEIDLNKARMALPILEETAYFNTGTIGVMARPVIEVYQANVERFQSRGWVIWDEMIAAGNQARVRMAAQIGARPEEITLTRNATDGANLVAAGLDWRPGDEAVISDQEHPAMLYPWTYQAQIGRIKLRTFKVEFDPAATLENFRRQITDRTRVIAVNHITSPYGIRLPAIEICALAREIGALSLVDGAQSFAEINVDVSEIGCDCFTGNCHKWLGGPNGAGFFYARQSVMERLQPCYVGAGSGLFTAGEGLKLYPDGRRFEFATRSEAVYATIPAALDWFDQLGWPGIEARTKLLSTYLKSRLSQIKGVQMLTPMEWERSSGLISFSLAGADHKSLLETLKRDWKVWPRTLDNDRAIRVSTAYFNTTEEIDRLVAGVEGYRNR